MKPAIEWGHAVDEAVAEDIQRDVLDAAADVCEGYAFSMDKRTDPRSNYQAYAARTLASYLRDLKP